MPALGFALFFVYVAVVFVGRALVLRRRTGTAGWHGISGRAGSAAWWGGILFAVALLAALLAPVLELTGVVDPIAAFDATGWHVAGAILFAAGFAGSVLAQNAMGAWWRVGVDDHEDVELVARGPFEVVRNPFFSALGVTAVGLALLVPNVVSFVALAALLVAIELQVRVVEEPFLRTQHGESYRDYTARVGRFVPGLGRDRRAVQV